jgi:hypothetical protein
MKAGTASRIRDSSAVTLRWEFSLLLTIVASSLKCCLFGLAAAGQLSIESIIGIESVAVCLIGWSNDRH